MTDLPNSSAPVRVLSLIKGLGPGGAEQLLLLGVRVADPARVDHRVAYIRADKTHLVGEFAACGQEPMRLGSMSPGRLGVIRDLRQALSHADVAHVHSPVLAAATRVMARTLPPRKRPAVVTTEHNEWTSHRWPTRIANALTTPLDSAHWAVSEQVRETMWRPMQRNYAVLTHGIDTRHLDVDTRTRSAMRAELGADDKDVLVLTVANLRRNKDYPNLLRAAQVAIAAEPRLRFAAVGQGPLATEIEALRDELSLQSRFSLLGFRRDIPELLAAADIFVLASAHEGLPVAVMEAFAAGLPVVATAVGGVPDQVRDGIEGVIAPPGDHAALAAALVSLAQDRELRTRMGTAARTRALTYDIRRAVEVQTEAYERLARRRLAP